MHLACGYCYEPDDNARFCLNIVIFRLTYIVPHCQHLRAFSFYWVIYFQKHAINSPAKYRQSKENLWAVNATRNTECQTHSMGGRTMVSRALSLLLHSIISQRFHALY